MDVNMHVQSKFELINGLYCMEMILFKYEVSMQASGIHKFLNITVYCFVPSHRQYGI